MDVLGVDERELKGNEEDEGGDVCQIRAPEEGTDQRLDSIVQSGDLGNSYSQTGDRPILGTSERGEKNMGPIP